MSVHVLFRSLDVAFEHAHLIKRALHVSLLSQWQQCDLQASYSLKNVLLPSHKDPRLLGAIIYTSLRQK
jgi:hypothetical protein